MLYTDEEVWCECSDDELYNPDKGPKGTWQPKPADILSVFEQLKDKKVLELSWKCPGRRAPGSDKEEVLESKEEVSTTPLKTEEHKPAVPNEFDFDDDDGPNKAVLTPRRTPGSAPKSQKKVARMDKVLKDMMQQRKLQAAEREARKQAGNSGTKSPRTPGSPRGARIGSPAGSPRTPPSSANRQSPVRPPGAGMDGIHTTPLRAPLDSYPGIAKPGSSVGESPVVPCTKPETQSSLDTGLHGVLIGQNNSQSSNTMPMPSQHQSISQPQAKDPSVYTKESTSESMDTS